MGRNGASTEDVAHNTQIEFRLIVWDEMQDPIVKDSLDFNLKINILL